MVKHMSVGQLLSVFQGKLTLLHRRSASEPINPASAAEEKAVHFNRSKSLIFLCDLPIYTKMDSGKELFQDLKNCGTIPKFQDTKETLANAQVWYLGKESTARWERMELPVANFTFVTRVQDALVREVNWDKFKVTKRNAPVKEAILWKIKGAESLKTLTFVFLEFKVFEHMRNLHEVEAPDKIWYVETGVENPQQEDQAINVTRDSVFEPGSQEVEIAQGATKRSLESESQSSRSSKSQTSASNSILARRGNVATPQETERRRTRSK